LSSPRKCAKPTARLSTTKVEVVRANDVQQRSPGSLDKVLDAVPGVEVHRTGGQVVSNVSIRGSSDMLGGGVGNRTLLLVDGKPAIISDTDGASWWLYPEDIISRVEVVKGAYSALYGSNAMGGVVNLITQSPTHREYSRIRASYGMYRNPASWMRYTEKLLTLNSLAYSHANTVGRLGYYANFTHRGSSGWRQSSAYDNVTGFLKLHYDYNTIRSLTFTSMFLSGENEYPHPWETSLHPLEVREVYENDLQRKQSLSTDLLYRRIESPESGYSLRFFYNRDLTRSLLNPSSEPREGDVRLDFTTRSTSHKFGVLEQSTRTWLERNTLVAGFDASWDIVDGQPEDYLYGRQHGFSAAVFAQNDYAPTEAWHITAGARLDHRNVVEATQSTLFSPKLGASFQATDELVVRAGAGHAFRNPSIAEMFLKKVGTQDYEFVPNPNLKPETVDFAEVGANYRIDDHVTLDGALFHYNYDKIIRWQNAPGGRFRTENLSEAVIQGGEIALRTAWPRNLQTTIHTTYLDTDIDEKGPLTYVPKWRYFASANYTIDRTTFGAELRYVGPIDTVVFYQTDEPEAYALWNFRLAFQFRQNTRLSLFLDNATDVQYEEMERYRMPPRTYRIELLYDFDIAKKD
jgi:iron complex outermembrane receptor protein